MGHIISAMSSDSAQPSSSNREVREEKRPVFVIGDSDVNKEEPHVDTSADVVMDLEDLEDLEDLGRDNDIEYEEEQQEEEKKILIPPVMGMSDGQMASVQNLFDLVTQQIEHGSNINVPKDACVIVVDLETTGLIVHGKKAPRITELAAVSLSNPSEFITYLVKLPDDVKIGPKAKEISGIDEKMCAEFGKTEIEVLLAFVVFVQEQLEKHKATKAYLVAHNAFSFDAVLLANAFTRTAFQTTLDCTKVFWTDSLVAARQSRQNAKNSLDILMKTGFPEFDSASMHRALADCMALCALIHSNRANMFDSLFFEKNTMKF